MEGGWKGDGMMNRRKVIELRNMEEEWKKGEDRRKAIWGGKSKSKEGVRMGSSEILWHKTDYVKSKYHQNNNKHKKKKNKYKQ